MTMVNTPASRVTSRMRSPSNNSFFTSPRRSKTGLLLPPKKPLKPNPARRKDGTVSHDKIAVLAFHTSHQKSSNMHNRHICVVCIIIISTSALVSYFLKRNSTKVSQGFPHKITTAQKFAFNVLNAGHNYNTMYLFQIWV